MAAPWDLNPYQYVSQNPVLYWDPDGRDKVVLPGAGTDLLVRDTATSGYKLSTEAKAVLGPIFDRTWGFDVSKVTVHFGPTGDGVAAFALGNTIIVNKGYWDQCSTQQRMSLLAHEMTHSVQYERLAAPGALSIGGGLSIGALVGRLAYSISKKVDEDSDGVVATILSSVISAAVAYWAIDKAPLLLRYRGESKRADNYQMPQDLIETPLEEMDVVDPSYTLDQMAERTAKEVDDLYDAEAAQTPDPKEQQ
jgi:hypothetical protein